MLADIRIVPVHSKIRSNHDWKVCCVGSVVYHLLLGQQNQIDCSVSPWQQNSQHVSLSQSIWAWNMEPSIRIQLHSPFANTNWRIFPYCSCNRVNTEKSDGRWNQETFHADCVCRRNIKSSTTQNKWMPSEWTLRILSPVSPSILSKSKYTEPVMNTLHKIANQLTVVVWNVLLK